MTNSFIHTLSKRRSQYALGRNVSLSQEEIEALIQKSVCQSPSSFNSQSSRAVILFSSAHEKLWNITLERLREMVTQEQDFQPTEKKIAGFRAGFGTVLFFEDQETIQKLQENYPIYANNFPALSLQSSAMAQFAVWIALAQANIGASLQHYSDVIHTQVTQSWQLPKTWQLIAEMPFGSNEKPFAEKSFINNDVRFKTFKNT